jgi:chemotaxis protein histidine kinase CheA
VKWEGTEILLSIPQKTSIVKSLIIGCAGEKFAIPQQHIKEIASIANDEKSSQQTL